MGKITFVLGGVRSGKSSYAVEIAKNYNKVAYVATSPYFDENMNERIKQHKLSRPADWHTFEEQENIPALLESIDSQFDAVIIDCLTLYVSMFLLDGKDEDFIKDNVSGMLEILKKVSYASIIVSNEVGLGVHPHNELARTFRDVAGRINQITAQQATEVVFMVSGLPLKLKG